MVVCGSAPSTPQLTQNSILYIPDGHVHHCRPRARPFRLSPNSTNSPFSESCNPLQLLPHFPGNLSYYNH